MVATERFDVVYVRYPPTAAAQYLRGAVSVRHAIFLHELIDGEFWRGRVCSGGDLPVFRWLFFVFN